MQIIIISIFLMPFVTIIIAKIRHNDTGVAEFWVRSFYPALFFILSFFIDTDLLGFGFYPLSSYMLILTCFLIILVVDYVFRAFRSGNHDQVGEAWMNLFLAMTLLPTTFFLCFLMHFSTQYENNLAGLGIIQNNQILKNTGFVWLCLLITVLFHFFCMFLFDIYRQMKYSKSTTYTMIDGVLTELKEEKNK